MTVIVIRPDETFRLPCNCTVIFRLIQQKAYEKKETIVTYLYFCDSKFLLLGHPVVRSQQVFNFTRARDGTIFIGHENTVEGSERETGGKR